jgi:hypothetical protein
MAKILGILTCVCIAFLGHGNGSDLPVREKVVAVAESQLHVRELTGNNDGPEVEAYLRITGLGPGYPWCAAFVSWVFHKAGVKAIRSARAADWFKPDKLVWHSKDLKSFSDFEFRQGMTLSFWYDRLGRIGHLAIGTGQDRNNYYTIEGNTNARGEREGQGVERKIRPKKMIYSISDHIKT